MEAIAEKLECKLHEWTPETSQKVRALVAAIIEWADDDALDMGCSRSVEQEELSLSISPPPDTFPTPSWHLAELRRRDQALALGAEKELPWDEAWSKVRELATGTDP